MTTAFEKRAKKLVAAAMRKLPARRTCPKCKKTQPRENLGMRVMARSSSGMPVAIRPQSWCCKCRRGN